MVAASQTDSYYETFTASSGLISSPNYPNPYPTNTYKFYQILAPSSATIKLQFLDLNLCAYDYWEYDELVVSLCAITAQWRGVAGQLRAEP